MTVAAAQAFIEKLKDDTFRARLAPFLSNVKPGDWAAVSQLACQYGYKFTSNDLKAEMKNRPGFFKGAGQHPDAGWDAATLSGS